MNAGKLALALLSSGLYIGSMAVAPPAAADPGPNCTLTTPADKAECGVITMVIGARTASLDPVSGGLDFHPT